MNKELARFLNVLSIPINGIFTYLNLSEYYVVALKKDIADYPFGENGPLPYFYKTAELYAQVNACYGIAFLVLMMFGIWNLKTRKIHGHLMLMLSFGLILLKIFHGLSR